jgi:bifunctional DNase/RNase
MIEMKIKHIAVEQESKSPIVFLTDMEETRYLPIWIGPFEAQSIVQVIEGMRTPRPMTHDLMKTVVDQLGAKVQRIIISDLQDQTFFAKIFLEQDGREIEVDARPSDSLALALRCKAPIFVTESVVQQASYPDSEKIARDKKEFKEFVERIKAEMFSAATEGPPGKPERPEEQ